MEKIDSINTMKAYILVCWACLLGMTMAVNGTNKIVLGNTSLVVDENDEGFYTVDVLLLADGASTGKISQNDTGLSIRLTARDGTLSAWHRLYINDEWNYYGQRNYLLSGSTRYLGFISSISLRVDKPEFAASSMPYYLCIHGTDNNGTINIHWNGCTYIHSSIGNKNESDHQYPLRDADGKLI